MNKKKYSEYKKEQKKYDNKVFSYNEVTLLSRNYSRKNFAHTYNKLVIFKNCKFEQTIIETAKFYNCLFENCIFSKFEFLKVEFCNVTFKGCVFEDILINTCKVESVKFEKNTYKNILMDPYFNIQGLDVEQIGEFDISGDLEEVLDRVILHKYIRESNTLFKKHKKTCPKSTKRELKKIKKKDADKLGMSKKERLEENARRKKERSKLQNENYQDSLLGKNRKVDKAVLKFLLMKYTEQELKNGLCHAMNNMKFKFKDLSFLLKYIEAANMLDK